MVVQWCPCSREDLGKATATTPVNAHMSVTLRMRMSEKPVVVIVAYKPNLIGKQCLINYIHDDLGKETRRGTPYRQSNSLSVVPTRKKPHYSKHMIGPTGACVKLVLKPVVINPWVKVCDISSTYKVIVFISQNAFTFLVKGLKPNFPVEHGTRGVWSESM